MIIFGVSSSERPGAALTDRCPHCGQRALAGYWRFRYFHLFWLPVIPLGSAVSVACEHCHLAMEKADLEPAQKDRALQGCRDLKRPRWHFIGTALIAGMIAMNAFDDARLEEKSLAAAAEPRVGDVWIIDVKDAWREEWEERIVDDSLYRYSAGQVTDVRDDEIEVTLSDYSFVMSSHAREHTLEGLAEQGSDYFMHDVTLPAARLVALQASNDFRLLR